MTLSRGMAALALAALLAGCTDSGPGPARKLDVLFARTPQNVVETMLRLAEPRQGEVLYDLGSGDGRIPVTAAKKHGLRAIGFEIDPRRLKEARRRAEDHGVTGLVEFREQDLFTVPLGEADIVTLFLLQHLNLKLRERLLRELKPGSRVVSYRWDMGDWKPERSMLTTGGMVYLWVIPPRR